MYSTLNKFKLWYLKMYQSKAVFIFSHLNYLYINHCYFTSKAFDHKKSTNSSKQLSLKEKMEGDTMKWCMTARGKYVQKCNKFCI